MHIRIPSFTIASVLITLLFGTGCTSVKLQATKDQASVRRIQRLFVLVDQGEIGKQTLSENFLTSFQSCLTNTPVQLASSISSPLELDERIHDAKIAAFDADAVLVIHIKTGVVDEFGGYPLIVYDASLFDAGRKKRWWRAVINNAGGTALMKRRMREMAEEIVSQLKRDGFL